MIPKTKPNLSESIKEWLVQRDRSTRKKSGTVAYFYKPAGAYPARVYVFMHFEVWRPRNLGVMGLKFAFPFLKRPMTPEEIEDCRFDTRLRYYQYETWEKLFHAEEQEAVKELNLHYGDLFGDKFIAKLKSFVKTYVLLTSKKIYKPKSSVQLILFDHN